MKLRTKIVLASGLPPLLIVPLIIVLTIFSDLQKSRNESVQQILDAGMALAARELDSANQQAIELARLMAASQHNEFFGDRKRSLIMMRNLLDSAPAITAAYTAYLSDAVGIDVRAATDGNDLKELDVGRRFAAYMTRSIDRPEDVDIQPLTDPERQSFYRGLVNRPQGPNLADPIQRPAEKARLSREMVPGSRTSLSVSVEPFLDRDRFRVGHAAPIFMNNELAGIVAVDRSLDDLDERLRSLKPYKSSEFVLVSARGIVLSATAYPEFRMRRIQETPYAKLFTDLFQTARTGQIVVATDPLTQAESMYLGTTIPHGNWRLLISVTQAEALDPLYHRTIVVLALVFVSGVLAMLLAGLLLRRIIARIERAASTAALVADGDLTVELRSNASDESGQMIRAIGDMVHALEVLVGKVKSASVQVVTIATDIAVSAQRQKEKSQEFDASTHQISHSTREIASTSQELLQTMTDVSAATMATADVAQNGRADLDRMERTMRQLSTATQSISGKLAVIAERASNIGNVVVTITRVADQTNLLSLNAAIEAEKAGEYGLGFSVVAREIRRLADQTAELVLDIEQMVAEMRGAVVSGVDEMSRFDEQVSQSVQEVIRIGAELGAIIHGVEKLGPRFETARQRMQSQVAGAAQISDSMHQLSEIASAGRQSSEHLHDVSAQLLGALDSLTVEVARFRIENK